MEINLESGTVIKATATRGNKPADWSPSGYHYRINAVVNGKRFSFDFWDSYNSRINNKPCDIRGALACWASDVFAGMNASDALDIYEEFGYTDPKEARRVFKGVKQAEEQFKRLNMTESDLSELANY